MFLDVSGSTALAERFGGIGAYSMISRFFFDVAQETARYGGETQSISAMRSSSPGLWSARSKMPVAWNVTSRFVIEWSAKLHSMSGSSAWFPRFRVGLHGGPIVAGECGDDKREIVYFGDTINTAARIQEACKDFQRPLLVSGELLRQMNFQPRYATTSLGRVKVRGREKEIELFAVRRDG